jgi:hypothetical protein
MGSIENSPTDAPKDVRITRKLENITSFCNEREKVEGSR